MKKSIYISFILFVAIFSLKSQTKDKDSILYIMPDKVELKINQYLETIDSSKYNLEFYLSHMDKEKYNICISIFNNTNNNYWYSNTNRFVLIGEKRYPLWFDYDVKFSTKEPSNTGTIGKREGQILKSHPIFDGYNITFFINGDILLEDYGIYKK